MDALNQPINVIENKFNDKLGNSEKVFCCSTRLFTQLIAVFIILDATIFFIQTYFRWGAPCFLWWNYVSTTLTFFMGHGTRLIGIPVGLYSIYSVRNNNIEGARLLFIFLLFASIVSLIDTLVCVFEVHNVCNSNEINSWNTCSHEWGKQEYKCVNTSNQECYAGLIYDNMLTDKNNCNDAGCEYVKNELWIKPECCSDSMWLYHNPCSSEPVIRERVFDTDWCENFSDFYDIGVQILTSAILFGFAYVVHSYKMVIAEPIDLRFTPNPYDQDE